MSRNAFLRVVIGGLSVVGALALLPSSAIAQSFDCRKATTAVEKMICADRELSTLDEQMARAFSDARKQVAANVIAQVAWLRDIRNRCASVDCLKNAYRMRIAALEKLNPAPALSIDAWAGEWTRVGDGQHESSTLMVSDVTADGFEFEISAASGANNGLIDGVAVRNAGGAIFKDEETKCEVTFTGRRDRLVVSTSSACALMGGIGVTFAGAYAKGRIDAPPPTLTALGVLASGVPEDVFSALVGDDYQLFVSSFHLLGDEKDLDGLGAKVVLGAVRGLFTSMEAIVMSRPDGTILAAVIDEDVIKYFSNEPRFKGKLPATIEKWRERFADKKVIFASVR